MCGFVILWAMSRLWACSVLCDCCSYLDSLYCYCLASFLGLQAVLIEKDIFPEIELNKPILFVAAAASQHFMEI